LGRGAWGVALSTPPPGRLGVYTHLGSMGRKLFLPTPKEPLSSTTKLDTNHKVIYAQPMPLPLTLSTGRCPIFEKAFPEVCKMTEKLIPLQTAVESLGVDFPRFNAWLLKKPARVAELKMIRARAMINIQENMVQGKQGWQAMFRLVESIEPDIWVKKSGQTKSTPSSSSRYSATVRSRA